MLLLLVVLLYLFLTLIIPIYCYFFQISMLPLMLFRPILHLKLALTGPSPRVSLIMAYTVSGCLLPLLSLLLCPHQHPHSRDPVKGRHHWEGGAHLTCENHLSMLTQWQNLLLRLDLQAMFVFPCMFSRNEWGPPDRKVDTRKYRAEPRSIFDYEPGKSSVLEQERTVSNQGFLMFNMFLFLHEAVKRPRWNEMS